MIELRNVSKYYHNKGNIASGISKVDLELRPGEFVVITGESGSGKTTLLNVISGLDTYEEGEMFIDGKETSHFAAADFEEYRKKYISNIFQEFNLVSSYTVNQNVDLVLKANGWKPEAAKARVREIVDRVGLSDFANTKVSKLSGGQMQRVAIARALAQDTEIIVADEPTGNLDSQSAADIAGLLSEISGDKLVIVVTHNFEQFRPYATRCIRMHDGKVVENLEIRPSAKKELPEKTGGGTLSRGDVLRLGARNTFNIGYKFILLLIVFTFLVFAVTSQYTSFMNQKAENSRLGYNNYFYNYSEDRIVLKKKDSTSFNDNDKLALSSIGNIDTISMNDILLDSSLYIEDGSFSYEVFPRSIDEFKGKLYAGRMPEKGNEVLLFGQEDKYNFSPAKVKALLDKTFTIYIGEDAASALKIKIVGVAFDRNTDVYKAAGSVYMTNEFCREMVAGTYYYYSSITTTINGKVQEYINGNPYYKVLPSSRVGKGKILLPKEADNFYKDEEAKGHTVKVRAENMYYDKTVSLKVYDTYTEKSFSYKSNYRSFDKYGGAVFISERDYARLFDKGNYQCSVFVKDLSEIDSTLEALENMGYITLPLRDAKVTSNNDLASIIQVPIIFLIMLGLFFVAYFVIRLILRTRKGYFSILRMIGISKRSIARMIDLELFIVLNIAFAIFLLAVLLVSNHIIDIEYVSTLIKYMHGYDYVILYAILVVMSWLISEIFARGLFKRTAIRTYREE
ncbi:MAG: ATP-binding cassette domain-containing protein [Firmicutes bacterium]|nr:ATP-binding cassette domain-containing protein [Bacillota bacterium]